MQNFSRETLTTIKKALVLELDIANSYGLATYAEEAQAALDAVNDYLEADNA